MDMSDEAWDTVQDRPKWYAKRQPDLFDRFVCLIRWRRSRFPLNRRASFQEAAVVCDDFQERRLALNRRRAARRYATSVSVVVLFLLFSGLLATPEVLASGFDHWVATDGSGDGYLSNNVLSVLSTTNSGWNWYSSNGYSDQNAVNWYTAQNTGTVVSIVGPNEPFNGGGLYTWPSNYAIRLTNSTPYIARPAQSVGSGGITGVGIADDLFNASQSGFWIVVTIAVLFGGFGLVLWVGSLITSRLGNSRWKGVK